MRSRMRWLRDVFGGGTITGKTTFRDLQNILAKIVKLWKHNRVVRGLKIGNHKSKTHRSILSQTKHMLEIPQTYPQVPGARAARVVGGPRRPTRNLLSQHLGVAAPRRATAG
jgi:hypothetical protein